MGRRGNVFAFWFRVLLGGKPVGRRLKGVAGGGLGRRLRSEQTIMAIAGHLSRRMLEHYSHIRIVAKRQALDAIATTVRSPDFERGVHQIDNQVQKGEKGGDHKLLN